MNTAILSTCSATRRVQHAGVDKAFCGSRDVKTAFRKDRDQQPEAVEKLEFGHQLIPGAGA
jgi:hypothetical protein